MTVTCRTCGAAREVHCTTEQVQRLQEGALIQNAMPDVPAAERELLISGICGVCFETMFVDDGEEEDLDD